ncbi:hypothetical protein ACFFX0_26840 [Citricoccus parietis]|uniref:Uncharacterized protein n=1 Tax=Citricoccus parietis TaxID=592307 RepID=A0ABV5G6Q6_9MICC
MRVRSTSAWMAAAGPTVSEDFPSRRKPASSRSWTCSPATVRRRDRGAHPARATRSSVSRSPGSRESCMASTVSMSRPSGSGAARSSIHGADLPGSAAPFGVRTRIPWSWAEAR